MLLKQLLRFMLTALFAISTLPASSHTSASNWDNGEEYDYVIVGLGTAGAVLARKLSDNCKSSVLVLEAGENYSHDPVILDLIELDNFNYLTNNPKFNFAYPQFTQGSEFGASVYMTAGRMWGGSSAHNYQLIARGTPSVWNSWAAFSGNSRWSYTNILPTMKKVETYTPDGTPLNPLQRGTNGPIFVTQQSPIQDEPFANAMMAATNTPYVPDYNDPTYGDVGISAYQASASPEGVRSFSINAYLPDSVLSSNGYGRHGRKLRVVSNATVNRVLFKGNKAKGVEYIHAGSRESVKKVYAKKKVILAAGALETPGILQRSGIGDRSLLESLGIDVLVDNPNVGANLSNQYGGTVFAAGPVTPEGFFVETGFVDLNPYYPNDGVRRAQMIAVRIEPGFMQLGGIIMQPKSLGSIDIVSKDPFTTPRLMANLYSDGSVSDQGSDAYTAVSIMKSLLAIAEEANDVVVIPPPETFDSDESILAYLIQNPNLTNHWSSTTRMAASSANGVVDGNLHVFGVKNLMIADLGVAPNSSDGNPSFAVYVIANEAAKIIAGK